MTTHHIYWWNLENLFDAEDSPHRSPFLKKAIGRELNGWTQEVLDKKLSNLATIMASFQPNGPDILGVCEVENVHVLELLRDRLHAATGRNYSILHHDSPDKRGIDTALFFDQDKYSSDGEVFTLRIIKRNPTRDLFQVHLTTANGNELVFVLNHWPARTAGVFKSEPH
ncbi:MAG: endonuclease, partial [Bacteroidota bacterium]